MQIPARTRKDLLAGPLHSSETCFPDRITGSSPLDIRFASIWRTTVKGFGHIHAWWPYFSAPSVFLAASMTGMS